jgi:hypothetical protein
MAWHDNRERIFTVGGSNSSVSVGGTNRPCQIQVTLGLSEWYPSQRPPNLLLEFSPVRLKKQIELSPYACEILRDLSLSLDQDRVLGIEIHLIDFHSIRTFLLPENGDKSFGACDQFEFADRRFHFLVEESHVRFSFLLLESAGANSFHR